MLRTLPRYATDLRVHGIVDPVDFGRMGFSLPAFPRNNDGGTGSGGGGASGSSSSDEDDTDDEKPLAEMSDAEKAKFWQRQARQNERKLKSAPRPEELEELRKAKKELDDHRAAQQSDGEKLTARAEAAEKKLAELEPRVLRMEVALEKGLTAKQAARLVGSTKEELEADADDLLEELGATRKGREEQDDKDKRDKRTAARKEATRDNGPRGDRSETKASVQSGADLFAARRKKTATAGSTSASS